MDDLRHIDIYDTNQESSSCKSSNSSGSFPLVAATMYRYMQNKKRKRTRRKTMMQHLLMFGYTVSFRDIAKALDPVLFQKSYRMSQQCFEQLLGDVRDLIQKPYNASTEYRRSTVPPEIRLAITLRSLADASYLDLMLGYQVGEETIRYIFGTPAMH